jgi:hypothetical protein
VDGGRAIVEPGNMVGGLGALSACPVEGTGLRLGTQRPWMLS